MRMSLCAVLAVCGCAVARPGPAGETNAAGDGVVATDCGPVRGSEAGATWAFRGIPYAAPPVGRLRWQPPEPAACWTEIRDTQQFGPVCAQTGTAAGWFGSEDCLTLNVWTPRERDPREALPVLFFIHGGGNARGAGSATVSTSVPFLGDNVQDGERLATEAHAVVVTINYRLGFLGWLAHPALAKSGNYGALDQIAALRWVQRNIAGFGGDPRRVLAFGQSGGGRDLCLLVAAKAASGLFARAGFLSSSCENFPSRQRAEAAGAQYAAKLGCGGASDVAACLRAAPTEKAVRASLPERPALHGWFQLGPIVDGVLLPDQPLAVFRSGAHSRVPALVSSTANEAALSLLALYWPGPIERAADYQNAVKALAPADQVGDILAMYPLENYPTPRAALTELLSDAHIVCPGRRTARALAGAGSVVWRSVWAHTASSGPARPFGPGHATDLPYWFDTLRDMPGFQPGPPEIALAQAMTAYLGVFAATGDPNHAGAAAWPRYRAGSDEDLRLDDHIEPGSRFRAAQCDFWDELAEASER